MTLPSASDACRAAEQTAIFISRIRRRGRRFNSDTHTASPRTRPRQVCTYLHTKSIILETPNPDCVPTTPHHLRVVWFPNRIRILFAMEHRLQLTYIFFLAQAASGQVSSVLFGFSDSTHCICIGGSISVLSCVCTKQAFSSFLSTFEPSLFRHGWLVAWIPS